MKKRMKALLLIAVVLILNKMAPFTCSADEIEYFIMCQPDSYVNVRESARTTSAKTGYLELGDRVLSDGKSRNGFTHVIGITEAGEGWVYSGFLIEDEPEIGTCEAWIDGNGRVACRRYVDGTRRKWLHNGDKVVVYAWGTEWSLTDQGFIKTEFLLAR